MRVIIAIFFATLLMVGCADRGASPQIKENITVQNKKLVSDFFSHFSNGNIDEAFALVSENASWWVPGDLPFSGTKTKAEYLQVVGAIQSGFPNGLKLEVTSMIAEGNKIAVEVASHGDHANGKTYANQYHFLITIENGEMVAVKEYMDTLHLFQLIQP